jgi:hypothetical protein
VTVTSAIPIRAALGQPRAAASGGLLERLSANVPPAAQPVIAELLDSVPVPV